MAAACGTEPGTVIVALDGFDDVTADTTIQLTGALTRSPPANTPLFLEVSGGASAVTDTANEEGRFSVQIALRQNQLNTLMLTPQDGSGSVGQPVSVDILQDRMGPTVMMMTPTGDGVATNTSVQVTLSEPVSLVGSNAGMRLLSGLDIVAGSSVFSTDSVTFTFTPSAPLPENAGFLPVFDGVQDHAGNEPTLSNTSCFITELTVAAQDVRPDTIVDDIAGLQLVGGPAPVFDDPADLSQIRTAIQDGMVSFVMKFTTPRSFDPADQNNTTAYIEIDTDQDSTTGVTSIRDSLFLEVGEPAFDTGIGADYIAIVERVGPVNVSAVGRYTGFSLIQVQQGLRPTFCGEFAAIRFSLQSLGNDDGDMDVSILTTNSEGQEVTSAWIVDPTPETEAMTIALADCLRRPRRRFHPQWLASTKHGRCASRCR